VMAPVCQCSSCRPVISTMGYSASGRSAAGIRSAGTNRARPVAVGKCAWNTTGSPGSPSFSQGYVTEESRDVVARAELDAFHDEVDALRDDAARLAARIERLRAATTAADTGAMR